MAKALTASTINGLDRMNVASQRAGGLGTILSAGITPPAVGTLAAASIMKYTVTPLVNDTVYVKAAFTLLAGAQPGIVAGITSPDVPRNVVITTSANQAGNVVIHGTDYADTVVTDTIAEGNTTTTAGVVAFKTITSIDYPARSNPADTVSVGLGVLIGMPVALNDTNRLISHQFYGTVDAGSMTASATLSLCVYTVAGTMNGVKKVELWFIN